MIYYDLTDAVFNAVLIDEDWDKALRLLSEAAGGASMIVPKGSPGKPESFRSYSVNYDNSVHASSDFDFASQFDPRTNPMIPLVYTSPVGKYLDRRVVCSDNDFYKVPFLTQVMVPQGLFHTCLVKLEHTEDLLSGCVLSVAKNRGPIEGDLLALFESWLPMLRGLLRLEVKLRSEAGLRMGLQSAVDHSDHGIVIGDSAMKVLSTNPEAERIFGSSGLISNVLGRLRVHAKLLDDYLAKCVHDTAAWTRERPAKPETFIVPDFQGRPAYEISVLPAQGVGRSLGISAGVATIVIEDLRRLQDVPSIDALRARFGLTVMQARVTQLLLLMPSASKHEIARKLGVEESTVRTHLAAARGIVGGRNLREFMQLVAGIRWR